MDGESGRRDRGCADGPGSRILARLAGELGEATQAEQVWAALARAAHEACGCFLLEVWVARPPQPAEGPLDAERENHLVYTWTAPAGRGAAVEAKLPLRAKGERLGHVRVALASAEPGAFSPVPAPPPVAHDWTLLQALVAFAAQAWAHLDKARRLHLTLRQAVEALAALAEARDAGSPHAAADPDHGHEMAHLAVAVGRELGIAQDRLQQLAYAAMLHDIGKLAIPDHVLQKRGHLTQGEWAAVRRHPAVGRAIVQRIESLDLAARIIHQHHEHFDGTGYPQGLAGEAILLEARIVAVIDAFTAMTTPRAYREARTARRPWRSCAATQGPSSTLGSWRPWAGS
ncbi:MAG: HD domain-containing protein [Limnochordaceae bacterium]|nr:HD domain-containing protein [Limnochordaceae bacterium]